ncbi:MAG: nicotinate-nucleotide--dimethylbenzimidazole phosphoribosyltransferase [Candidatus Competibacterales bacterium]
MTVASSRWLYDAVPAVAEEDLAIARRRQGQLTKPAGSLGILEALGVRLAAMQGTERPYLERVGVAVFAADHGVASEDVSAYPQSVTGEMVRNFARGGAAISVLARLWRLRLRVYNLGTVLPLEDLPDVRDCRIAAGTRNLRREAAMTPEQLAVAMATGRDAVEDAARARCQLFIGGEMGIGGTTAATAVACALLNRPPLELVGPGTGLDGAGVAHKTAVIDQALARCRPQTPLGALAELGGFELAALAGALIRCAQRGLPSLVDGYIATTAALVAVRLRPEVAPWLFYAHRSAEPGHGALLAALATQPLLTLDMALGEGSGAAVALPLLRAAAALHGEMATFAEAGVSRR